MLGGIITFFRVWNRWKAVRSAQKKSLFLAGMTKRDVEAALFGSNLVWVK